MSGIHSRRGVEIHNGEIVIPSNDVPAGLTAAFAEGLLLGLNIPATAIIDCAIGIHSTNQVEVQPTTYWGIRYAEHGPVTITIRSLLYFYIPRADVTWLMELVSANKTAWQAIGTVTGGERGWLSVRVGTTPTDETRYIKLFDGPAT
ncbi:hypothetical protein MUP59_02035 [Candidatus Bathyarchaeota archaeon]|nr:hypothetical protein [Candidatus Bathyarchaeota archaeon]